MSEHDFISLGIPLGTSRLTISATTTAGMIGFLNDLNEEDPVEQISPINDVLEHINAINAAVTVKMPQFAPSATPQASAPVSQNSAPAGNGGAKTCEHGVMTYRKGTTKSGPNVGKEYEAYFCPAPRGTNQCKPVFV